MAIIEWKEAAQAATLTASQLGRREWSAPYLLISDNDRDDQDTPSTLTFHEHNHDNVNDDDERFT